MDFQNIESSGKKLRRRQEQMAGKMWQVENIKANLSKIINYKGRVNESSLNTPSDASFTSSQLYAQKPNYLSPRSHPIPPLNFTAVKDIASIQTGKKCSNCENNTLLLRQKSLQAEKLLQKCSALTESHSYIFLQREKLKQKVFFLERQLQKLRIAIEPYKNNVNLMEKHLDMIKEGHKDEQKTEIKEEQNKKHHWKQVSKSPELELYLIQKYYQRQQKANEQKLCHFNDKLSLGQIKIRELQKVIETISHENQVLKKVINESEYVNRQRQLLLMSSEQMISIKNLLFQERQKTRKQAVFISKLRNKIYMLTSLIGYGVLSNLQSNDLHQLAKFRDSIQNAETIKRKLTFQQFGMNRLKNQDWAKALISEYIESEQNYRILYQENILSLYQAQEIKTALQETTATIIKPEFFLLIRSIFDSKYIEYVTEGVKSSKFIDFTFNFIQSFKLNKYKKRVELSSKKDLENGDNFKTNFLLRLFDHKIGFLPEIVTLRQFLLKNTADDEIFYYLMVRNIIYDGPELQNYISCSEPYNFVPFKRTIDRIQYIISYLDKNTKAIILNHLTDKKVSKNKRFFIKGNYVSRLLLEVYRKVKKEKINKLRNVFQQSSRCIGSDILKLAYFRQLIQKNFLNVDNLSIISFYRKTLSIFNTNKDSSFFECFHSTCLDRIFLAENLKSNINIKRQINDSQQKNNLNYLIQLIPDSVICLGNIKTYDQYSNLIKENRNDLQKQVKVNQFLMKLVHGKLQMSRFFKREEDLDHGVGENKVLQIQRCMKKKRSLYLRKEDQIQDQDNCKPIAGGTMRKKQKQEQEQEQVEKQGLKNVLSQINRKLIDFVNKEFQKRLRYEQKLESASSLIGKEAKKKIYQFYSDFIKDIKGQLPTQ